MGKTKWLALARRGMFLVLGNACCALSINLFLAGNGIAAGGFSGLAIALNHFFYVPIGAFVLVLSLPLLIWAVFCKGWGFVLSTLAATALYSVFVDLSAAMLPTATDDLLLAAICGVALNGLAAVLFLQADCSDGGTDLLARLLLTRRKDLSLGKMFLLVDGAVVLFSMLVNRNLEIGVVAAVSLAVNSYVSDRLIQGMNKASVYFIITSGPPEPIAQAIFAELGRGVTRLSGEGMYAKTDRSVLLTVVKPSQSYRVKALVKRIDPGAFVFLAPASEVVGKGFIDVDATAGK